MCNVQSFVVVGMASFLFALFLSFAAFLFTAFLVIAAFFCFHQNEVRCICFATVQVCFEFLRPKFGL